MNRAQSLGLWLRAGCLSAAWALLGAGCGEADRAPSAAGSGAGRPAVAVEVWPVEARDWEETLSVVGSIAANESAVIRPEINGRVREVLFKEGEVVKAGTPMLQLDDAELSAQLAQAQASLDLAQLNLRRAETLAESRSRSQSDLDRARSEHERAAAEVRLLSVRLDKAVVRAPFDGTLGARAVSVGETVSPATPVTTLQDLSRLKVEFSVPEAQHRRLAPGATFILRASREERAPTARGRVFFVSPVVERETRSVAVKGWVDPESGMEGLRPGLFVTVDLVLEVRPGALVVPEGAILVKEGRAQLVVARGGESPTAEIVPVRTGLRSRGIVEVEPLSSGAIRAGDRVVASGVGALLLMPGDRLVTKELRQNLRPPSP